MKLSVIFVLVGLMQVSASVYSQSTKLSVEVRNQKVVDVLKAIEDQSEFRFFYKNEQVDVERKVSINVENLKVEAILDQLFDGSNTTYKFFDDKLILLSSKAHAQSATAAFSQQQNNVSGTVTDEGGQPLPGVTVLIKGTTNGTVTNFDGKYTLNNLEADAVLQFSFVGMVAQEIQVGNQSVIDVKMAVDAIGLEEVVAVGYGVQKKVNLTGAVTAVKTEEIATVPVTNVSQALMGRAPGLYIKNVSGQPGADNIQMNIRGFSAPLIIIDGLEASQSEFGRLNPADIAEINVLKDAAAGAIYGARAGNGVILVTTKRGTDGLDVTMNSNLNLQFFTMHYDFVDSYEYAALQNVALMNEGKDPVWTADQLEKFKQGNDPQYPNTNWWDLTLREFAPQSNNTISIRGGNDKVKYFVSAGYMYQEGLLKSDDIHVNRYTLRSNIDAQLTKKLKLQVDMNVVDQEFDEPYYKMQRDRRIGIMTTMFRARAYWPSEWPDPTKEVGHMTPLKYSKKETAGWKNSSKITGNARLRFEYDLPFGIKASAQYNFKKYFNSYKEKGLATPHYIYDWDNDKYTQRGTLNSKNEIYEYRGQEFAFSQQYGLNWAKDFNEHSLAATGVVEIIKNNSNNIRAGRKGYDLDIDYLFAGPKEDMYNDGTGAESGRVGLISRINYSYKGKYLVELNGRYDGSPKFPEEGRWGFFPSASAGWRISEESFMDFSKGYLSNLKLRVSHGLLGEDNTGSWQYLSTYKVSGSYVYDGSTGTIANGLVTDVIANPNITWEKMSITNYGLDFGFLNNKISGSFEYFYRKRWDVLEKRNASILDVVGASLPKVNYAEYDYRGLEGQLTYQNSWKELKYSITGNLAWNRAKQIYKDQGNFRNKEHYRISNKNGEWTDRFWGYMSDGLFQSQEEIDNWPDQDGKGNRTMAVGDIRYKDYNGDGRITGEDRVILGRGTTPKFNYGLGVDLRWRNFGLHALVQGASAFDVNLRKSNDITLMFYAENTPQKELAHNSYIPENPWIASNTVNPKYPRFRTDGTNRKHRNKESSDFWLMDGTYARLKTVEFSYYMPKKLMQKLRLGECRVYASGYNLATWTKADLGILDPEANTSVKTLGDYYPPTGNYNIGIELKF